MIRNSKVLTEEANHISLVSARRAATQGGCMSIIERQIPVNAPEQNWMFEVAKTPVNIMTSGRMSPVVRAAKWLNHLGNGRIDDSRLQATHNDFRVNGIGL